MSGFTTDWLAMRARFDSAARSDVLEERLGRYLEDRVAGSDRAVQIVDLGAGSGNNYRHLAPRLPIRQHWTLLDADAALLRATPDTADVSRMQVDLSKDLGALIPHTADLVTASALIDLVSLRWLTELLSTITSIGAALLLVLTYDGRIRWSDGAEEDDMITDLVNRHQRGDKGFGPALGPDAPRALQDLIGPNLQTASSDWVIGPDDKEMRAHLVDGWGHAAWEIDESRMARIADWAERRRSSQSRLVVGHADQLYLPQQ